MLLLLYLQMAPTMHAIKKKNKDINLTIQNFKANVFLDLIIYLLHNRKKIGENRSKKKCRET